MRVPRSIRCFKFNLRILTELDCVLVHPTQPKERPTLTKFLLPFGSRPAVTIIYSQSPFDFFFKIEVSSTNPTFLFIFREKVNFSYVSLSKHFLFKQIMFLPEHLNCLQYWTGVMRTFLPLAWRGIMSSIDLTLSFL